MTLIKIIVLFTVLLNTPTIMGAPTLTDSGWVNLIQPNFKGLYSFLKGRGIDSTVHRSVFSITANNEIYCDVDSGHVGTLKRYSHYRMRVQFKFGTRGPGAWGTNAGIMYHIDETAPYMVSKAGPWWPQSIEAQILTTEVGAAYSVAGIVFDTYKNPNKSTYLPKSLGGDLIEIPTARRSLKPLRNNYNGDGNWTDYEIVVRGAERAEHWVMGEKVMELQNIRINSGGSQIPYGTGNIALQDEVKEIWYRNWHIMELPPTGPDRLPLLTLDSNVFNGPLSVGNNINITWSVQGEVDKINLEFTTNGIHWINLSKNATNPYQWKIPSTKFKIRISAWSFLAKDSVVSQLWSNVATLPALTLKKVKLLNSNLRLIKQFLLPTPATLLLYNLQGIQVKNLPLSPKTTEIHIGQGDVQSKLPSGVYFLKVISGSQVNSFKLFIEN